MTTTFQVTAKELDQSFLDRVKSMFRERPIAITISDQEEKPSNLPFGTAIPALLKLQGMITQQDAEEMKRAIQEQRRTSPEEIAAYQERVRALRGILEGIDTTVERDSDRV